MKCSNCGTEYIGEQGFCKSCGHCLSDLAVNPPTLNSRKKVYIKVAVSVIVLLVGILLVKGIYFKKSPIDNVKYEMYKEGKQIVNSINKLMGTNASIAGLGLIDIENKTLKEFSKKYINSAATEEERAYNDAISTLVDDARVCNTFRLLNLNESEGQVKEAKETYEKHREYILSNDYKNIRIMVNLPKKIN